MCVGGKGWRRGEREREREEIRAISLHPSGTMIMDERKVMDGRMV